MERRRSAGCWTIMIEWRVGWERGGMEWLELWVVVEWQWWRVGEWV